MWKVERVRKLLEQLVNFSGLSRREVERRLIQLGRGTDVCRLLAGKLDLKVSQVLGLCEVLEIHPVELFQIAFRAPREQSPLRKRLSLFFSPSGDSVVTQTGAASKEDSLSA